MSRWIELQKTKNNNATESEKSILFETDAGLLVSLGQKMNTLAKTQFPMLVFGKL